MTKGAELAGRLVEELKRSPKYRFLCESTLSRAAAFAAARESKEKAALKTAKRKLHQIYGAYFGKDDLDKALRLAERMPEKISSEILQDACREFLALHASTAERIPYLDDIYSRIFGVCGDVSDVVDLCCGFHPFGLPWMPLGSGARYRALDIDTRMMDLLSSFFSRSECSVDFSASACDLSDLPGPIEADLVLLLKTLPGLERQENGMARRLLGSLRSRCVAVSFPAKSLGGKEKGMRENYERDWLPFFEEMDYTVEKIAVPTETFYVLSRSEFWLP